MVKNFLKICLVVFSIYLSVAFSQTSKSVQIKQSDAYSRKIDLFIKRHQKSEMIFGNVSSTEKSKWRKFKTDSAREKADTGENLNENALVWRDKGKVIAANFTFQSGSRDWAHYVMYYFRPDGTLAKVDATLNTFYGNMTVERAFYFDKNGKLIHKVARYLDLTSQKPRKPNDGFLDNEVIFYKKVSKLPFAFLL